MLKKRGSKRQTGEQTGEQIQSEKFKVLYPCGFQGIIQLTPAHHIPQTNPSSGWSFFACHRVFIGVSGDSCGLRGNSRLALPDGFLLSAGQ